MDNRQCLKCVGYDFSNTTGLGFYLMQIQTHSFTANHITNITLRSLFPLIFCIHNVENIWNKNFTPRRVVRSPYMLDRCHIWNAICTLYEVSNSSWKHLFPKYYNTLQNVYNINVFQNLHEDFGLNVYWRWTIFIHQKTWYPIRNTTIKKNLLSFAEVGDILNWETRYINVYGHPIYKIKKYIFFCTRHISWDTTACIPSAVIKSEVRKHYWNSRHLTQASINWFITMLSHFVSSVHQCPHLERVPYMANFLYVYIDT